MAAGKSASARRLALLGILLQLLHVLFGITAIIGMLINHTKIKQTHDTIYHSQLRWQLVSFWVCAALYAVALWHWVHSGMLWPLLLVLVFAGYRIATSIWYWYSQQAINRIL